MAKSPNWLGLCAALGLSTAAAGFAALSAQTPPPPVSGAVPLHSGRITFKTRGSPSLFTDSGEPNTSDNSVILHQYVQGDSVVKRENGLAGTSDFGDAQWMRGGQYFVNLSWAGATQLKAVAKAVRPAPLQQGGATVQNSSVSIATITYGDARELPSRTDGGATYPVSARACLFGNIEGQRADSAFGVSTIRVEWSSTFNGAMDQFVQARVERRADGTQSRTECRAGAPCSASTSTWPCISVDADVPANRTIWITQSLEAAAKTSSTDSDNSAEADLGHTGVAYVDVGASGAWYSGLNHSTPPGWTEAWEASQHQGGEAAAETVCTLPNTYVPAGTVQAGTSSGSGGSGGGTATSANLNVDPQYRPTSAPPPPSPPLGPDFVQAAAHRIFVAGYPVCAALTQVLAFDYDGDLKQDLLLYQPGARRAVVARSVGDGTFTRVFPAVGQESNGIGGYDLRINTDRALAFDYNGDGKDDLFLYRRSGGAAFVIRSNGDGTFTPVYAQGDPGLGFGGFNLNNPVDQVLKFDYDGDHRDDILLYRPGTGAIYVVRSNGDGTFQTVYARGEPGDGIAGYDLASPRDRIIPFDYNADGRDDLFLYRAGNGAAWVARSNGDGSFTQVYARGDPGDGIAGFGLTSTDDQVLAFDYNGDSRDDLALFHPGTGAIYIARSNGDGTFTAVYAQGDPGRGIGGYDLRSAADRILAFDYNCDGKQDLVLYRPGRGAVFIVRSNGDATFTPVYTQGDQGLGVGDFRMSWASDRILAFDVDGDRRQDLLAYNIGQMNMFYSPFRAVVIRSVSGQCPVFDPRTANIRNRGESAITNAPIANGRDLTVAPVDPPTRTPGPPRPPRPPR
jgi:hypothetical protein